MTMSYDPDMTIPSLDLVRCSMLWAGKRREHPDDAVPVPVRAALSDRLVCRLSARDRRLRPPQDRCCSGGSRSGPGAATPVALRVTNSNWSDVRIYVVRGAMWLRLGTVTTNSTVDFTIPVDYLSGAGTVTLVADPVAVRPWTTALPVISPGDEFELVVENFLQYSHLVVR